MDGFSEPSPTGCTKEHSFSTLAPQGRVKQEKDRQWLYKCCHNHNEETQFSFFKWLFLQILLLILRREGRAPKQSSPRVSLHLAGPAPREFQPTTGDGFQSADDVRKVRAGLTRFPRKTLGLLRLRSAKCVFAQY